MNSVDEECVGLFATLDNRTEGGETASDPVKNYYGAILNVKLVVSQIVVVPNGKTNISLGALVGRNNGLIANCSVELNGVNIKSTSEMNIGGLVGENNGLVLSCEESFGKSNEKI